MKKVIKTNFNKIIIVVVIVLASVFTYLYLLEHRYKYVGIWKHDTWTGKTYKRDYLNDSYKLIE